MFCKNFRNHIKFTAIESRKKRYGLVRRQLPFTWHLAIISSSIMQSVLTSFLPTLSSIGIEVQQTSSGHIRNFIKMARRNIHSGYPHCRRHSQICLALIPNWVFEEQFLLALINSSKGMDLTVYIGWHEFARNIVFPADSLQYVAVSILHVSELSLIKRSKKGIEVQWCEKETSTQRNYCSNRRQGLVWPLH